MVTYLELGLKLLTSAVRMQHRSMQKVVYLSLSHPNSFSMYLRPNDIIEHSSETNKNSLQM